MRTLITKIPTLDGWETLSRPVNGGFVIFKKVAGEFTYYIEIRGRSNYIEGRRHYLDPQGITHISSHPISFTYLPTILKIVELMKDGMLKWSN